MNPKLPIAYFVTPHGFGHAARASAVMNAIYDRWPFVYFEIFGLTPEWFFSHSLKAPYVCHAATTDIGLVQTSPLHFDLSGTIDALETFMPFDDSLLDRLAEQVTAADCHLVISDIAPLGIAVATHAGLPSVLVENFTWDWIYEPYVSKDRRFKTYIDIFWAYYNSAGLRIKASPVCGEDGGHPCTPPVSRMPFTEPQRIRERIGIKDRDKMVLITMGGISGGLPLFDKMAQFDDSIRLVLPGASADLSAEGETRGKIILLPQKSDFYHPDLVNAADAVVGKVGYSTLAEVYHAGVPYGFVSRSEFRESPVFESYIQRNMEGIQITEADFTSGVWGNRISELLTLPRRIRNEPNGADAAAMYICDYLACEKEILEVVDADGCVVGAAPRKCVHGNNRLMHRVVHVLVCDKQNRLLLQKRSLNKRVAPGRWDTSVGGHVDCGESIESAMHREMEEELGIRPLSPTFAYQYIHSNEFESELVFTYVCRYDGKISFNPEEIDSVRFWEMGDIEACLGKGKLSDNFEDEFRRYRKWRAKGISID